MFYKYCLLSTFFTSSMIWYAFDTRQQFYPSVVFLVTSKVCVALLGNQAIVLTLVLGRMAKTIFLGSLREVEVELLYENARYAVTETCLALTIFREELSTRVVALFSALLFAKVFHWLAASRVDYLEHADRVSYMTHGRLTMLMTWLFLGDAIAFGSCGYLCYVNGPSVLLLFGFEFAILAVAVAASFARYGLYGIEHVIYDGQWTGKGSHLFFVDFFAEATRFLFYVAFFGIVLTYYGVPLHIVRELWVSYVSLKRRFAAYCRYRALSRNMDQRFPEATPDELDACGRVCIICRELMDGPGPGFKKLPCGHIFHVACLRLWFQQQQTCPTCRADVPTDAPPPPPQPTAAAAAAAQQRVERFVPVQDAAAAPVVIPPQAQGAQNDDADQPPPEQQPQAVEAARDERIQRRTTSSRRRLPPGARIMRVLATADVLTEKRLDAPVRRRLPAGARVLTQGDADPNFLRLGDGWLKASDVVPYDDDTPPSGPQPTITDLLKNIQAQLVDIQQDLKDIKLEQARLRALSSSAPPPPPLEAPAPDDSNHLHTGTTTTTSVDD